MKKKCYVIPSAICNCECFYCVNRFYGDSKNQYMDVLSEQFSATLEHLYRLGINYFEITGGGEPFLNDSIQDIVNLIRKQVPDSYIKLYTNGTIKKEIKGVQELNISTVHWLSEVLVDAYKNENKANLLEQLQFFYNPKEYKIRLSVPIYKGGIDCEEKAKQLIKMTEEYVDAYVFRPMSERTPNRKKLFVDFDITGDNIEVDRDFSCFSKITMWWTDNHLYDDWTRKRCIF